MLEEWKQNILYLVLFFALMALGFFLDWLHNKYPEMMAPKVKTKKKVKPKKARPEQPEPDRIKNRGRAHFVRVRREDKIPEPGPETKAATGSGSQGSVVASTGQSGPCPRCGGTYRNFCVGFIFIRSLDGGLGELYQCGMCGKYWDRDVTYDKSRELDPEAVKRILSDGETT